MRPSEPISNLEMRQQSPTVTAVMFVYNEEKYIGEMLTSIYNQTTPATKVIVIDDFSTDGTVQVINKFQKVHSNLEVHQSKQKGKVFAYVSGLEKVTTDYFFICAGDDYLFPEYISDLLKEIENKNLEFIYARYLITDSNLENPIEPRRTGVYTRDEIIRANRVSGYLFGKSEIIKTILPIPTEVSFEDWITSLRLADKYKAVHLSTKPLFYYRKHQSSTSEQLQNIGMRQRDIRFINFLLQSSVIQLTQKDRRVLNTRLKYCRQLVGESNVSEIVQLLTSKHLFTVDRVRLLLLLTPFVKNDNGAQRVLNKLASFLP